MHPGGLTGEALPLVPEGDRRRRGDGLSARRMPASTRSGGSDAPHHPAPSPADTLDAAITAAAEDGACCVPISHRRASHAAA